MKSLPSQDCSIIDGGILMTRSMDGAYCQASRPFLRNVTPRSFGGESTRMNEFSVPCVQASMETVRDQFGRVMAIVSLQ